MGYLSFKLLDSDGTVEAVLNITPVPEPTSMLVFAGVAGLVALRAKQSRS
jgi:PEP-CTERM motif